MKLSVRRLKHAIRRRIRADLGIHNQFDSVLLHLLKPQLETPGARPVIFDVGAHYGESIERFRNLFANSTIHAFEPDVENFKVLNKHWGGKDEIILNNFGISKMSGTMLFHRNIKNNTSSFNAVNPDSEWVKKRSAQFGVTAEGFTEDSYEVPVVDLDSYISKHRISRIHLLKIDTQGHEDEVLAGCGDTLKNGMVDVVETELIVGNPYVRSLQFYDIEKFLIPLGFRFYAISKGGDLLQKPSLAFNVIYVHQSLLD